MLRGDILHHKNERLFAFVMLALLLPATEIGFRVGLRTRFGVDDGLSIHAAG